MDLQKGTAMDCVEHLLEDTVAAYLDCEKQLPLAELLKLRFSNYQWHSAKILC